MKGKYFLKQAEKQLSENESEDYISSSESESESLTTKVDSEMIMISKKTVLIILLNIF